MKELKYIIVLLAIGSFFTMSSCTVQYSLTGASIDYNAIKTLSVQYFPNRAEIIVPTLSQQFTEALRDKFRSQTKLKQVTGMGDVNFEGEISRYATQSMAIQSDAKPAKNRLTIEIKVRYTNNVKPEQNFETSFSRYEDYDSNVSLSSVESDLIEKIIDQLTDDVFNKAFVNW
jgi:hypothetical protein